MTGEPLLVWVRLFDGRLWHIEEHTGLWTACGRRIDTDPDRMTETLPGGPPGNGWVCDRCVRRLADQAHAARQAWLHDPRRRPGDSLPAPDADRPPDGESNTNPADVTTTVVDHNEQEER